METIELDGINIFIKKKSMKHMYLRVLPPDGQVFVTAPYSFSDEEIREFIFSKRHWIRKQKKRFESRVDFVKTQYVTGERCYLWGKEYELFVQDSKRPYQVRLLENQIVMQIGKDSTIQQREQLVNEWYRMQLKQAMPSVLQKCEKLTGLIANEWRIKNMRTRWGTCNIAKKRIWLNLQLAKKPPECLEYVVIHELVHLLERSHNARFYGYMSRFYPDWKSVRERLNEMK